MASDKKTLKQLIAQQNEINAAIESARAAEIEAVKKNIAEKAAEFGYDSVLEFIGFLGYRVSNPKKSRQIRIRLSDAQKEEVRTKLKSGAKVADIRKEYGISYGTANQLKKAAIAS